MNNSMKKYVEITGKTGFDKIYPLLDKVESDLDEDVDNKMNDSDEKFFGNDEGDYNSGSVANACDILVPAANVHSSSSGSPSFNCSARSKKKTATWSWNSNDKILLHFSSDPRPFDVFEKDIDLNKFSHIVAQTNLMHHRMVVIW